MRVGLAVALVALAGMPQLAGCLDESGPDGTAEKGCPDPAQDWIPALAGTGTFQVLPEVPSVALGKPTSIEATFHNTGGCSFYYDDGGSGCHAQVVRIGAAPLLLTEDDLDPPTPALDRTCTRERHRSVVAPGETLSRVATWNGSFSLWDHRALETGAGWRPGRFWAEPGAWPLSVGFTAPASHPTERHLTLQVQGDVRSPDAALSPAACRQPGEGEDAPRLTDARLDAPSGPQPLGSPATLRLHYILEGAAGCWVMPSLPSLIAEDAAGRVFHLGGYCTGAGAALPRSTGLLRMGDGPAVVDLAVAWDGSDPCDPGAAPAKAGPARVRLDLGGAAGEGREAVVEWSAATRTSWSRPPAQGFPP